MFVSTVAALALLGYATADVCPPFFPTLPIYSPLSNSQAVQQATSDLKSKLDTLVKNGTDLGNANTSFSLDVYSIHDESALFSYDFTGSTNAKGAYGVHQVDSNTIYRIGSVSKVVPVYVWLLTIGNQHWYDSVTKWIPELEAASKNQSANSIDNVDWEQVTPASLASQLSGIARGTGGYAQIDAVYAEGIGLPKVAPAPGQYCNGSEAYGLYPCSRKVFFENLLGRHPVHAVSSTPVYSNIAYQIFAWTLEAISGKDYNTLVNQTITRLSMNSSYYPVIPKSAYSNAIIPFDPATSGFSDVLYTDAPSGAFYSSINDMRNFGMSILNATFMPPTLRNWWLKPASFTPDRYMSVGAPWEIIPYPPNSRFPTNMYTKAGDFGMYSSIMALLPDYGVGFTVMAAGDRAHAATRELADQVSAAIVPSLNVASKEQASGYGGSFASAGPDGNSTIQLSVVQISIGPVLRLDSWEVNGVSIVEALAVLLKLPNPAAVNFEFNLYPTGLVEYQNGNRIESWRAGYTTSGPDPLLGSTTSGPFSTACEAWTEIDGYDYGEVGFDEFLLEVSEGSGKVEAVSARVLQEGFQQRTSSKRMLRV